jgi:threonine/homoserine/homoserine lactone efflux protein
MNLEGTLGLVLLLISLAWVPGPSDLLVAGAAVRYGYRSAVAVALGIVVADLLLILIVLGGAGLLLEYMVSYGAWLGKVSSCALMLFGLWLIRIRLNGSGTVGSDIVRAEYGFAGGFGITFFDPKALAFYFGVLPTFFDISSFGLWQVALLVLIVSAVICATKAFYAWSALEGSKLLTGKVSQTIVLRVLGTALIIIGGWRLI